MNKQDLQIVKNMIEEEFAEYDKTLANILRRSNPRAAEILNVAVDTWRRDKAYFADKRNRIILQREQICNQCKAKLSIGEDVVRVSAKKALTPKPMYYHIQCP